MYWLSGLGDLPFHLWMVQVWGAGPPASPMRMHCGMFVGTMGVLGGRMEIWSFRQSACLHPKEVFTQNWVGTEQSGAERGAQPSQEMS